MSLRNYFQDLIRTQNCCHDGNEEDQSMQITVVNDNLSCFLPDEYGDDCVDHAKMDDSFVLAAFRRKQRMFRELLSPRRNSKNNNKLLAPAAIAPITPITPVSSPIAHFSPERLNGQLTPTSVNGTRILGIDSCKDKIAQEDTQRGRMARLKRSLREQQQLRTQTPLL
eukprot:jgi/Psemu1/17344/gm1.17344_g